MGAAGGSQLSRGAALISPCSAFPYLGRALRWLQQCPRVTCTLLPRPPRSRPARLEALGAQERLGRVASGSDSGAVP